MEELLTIDRRARGKRGRSGVSHIPCHKLRKMAKEKQFNRQQQKLFWAEHGRRCRGKIPCVVCQACVNDPLVCDDCLISVYCSPACQEKDVKHVVPGK